MEKIILTNVSLDEIVDKIVERLASSKQELIHHEENKDAKEYLSVEEASELIRLAVTTIYGLTHNKAIPYLKKGRKLWFKRSELLQWLDSGRKETKEESEADALDHFRKYQSHKRR